MKENVIESRQTAYNTSIDIYRVTLAPRYICFEYLDRVERTIFQANEILKLIDFIEISVELSILICGIGTILTL